VFLGDDEHAVKSGIEPVVAVKAIKDGRMRPDLLNREVTISRLLSATSNPYILEFRGYLPPGSADVDGSAVECPLSPLSDHHYLVMEVASGGDLFTRVLDQPGGLTEAEAGPFMIQLCDAVLCAHSLGVVHRDLKLENVLLTKDGLGIKLMDWGLAFQHVIEDGSVVPALLHSRCGSRSYMAPEIATLPRSNSSAGSNAAESQSLLIGYDGFLADVWSLGICLFAMCVGFFPFEVADPYRDWRARQVIEAQSCGRSTIETIFAFYPKKNLHLSKELTSLLDRMLQFDPACRYSMADVRKCDWLLPFTAACRLCESGSVQSTALSSKAGGIGISGLLPSGKPCEPISASFPLNQTESERSSSTSHSSNASNALHSMAHTNQQMVVAGGATAKPSFELSGIEARLRTMQYIGSSPLKNGRCSAHGALHAGHVLHRA